MSDKSFGDCPNRNIVKNPLLSTAVTGLSIEDLTHNAVLVPVAATQGLITRSDPQIPTDTLARSEHEFTNFPSGDSNTNVFSLQNNPPIPPPDQPPITQNRPPEIPTSSVSKASLKSDDDFDVNEYFARLQGTRYVSAPINSNPDQNADLGAEDNLEEINLNDDKTGPGNQSLTADIAQNFSQLPTVLPHVASAVFSSFSNMLSYKSREQTPDDRGCQDVPFQSPGLEASGPPGFVEQSFSNTPLAENIVKEVAPPPKELPAYVGSNFRITTKKKYAQIPGLSSGHNFETAQKIELNPLTKNITGYFIPTSVEKVITEPLNTQTQETDHNKPLTRQNKQETYNIFNPIETDVKGTDIQPLAFVIPRENEPKTFEERLPPPPISFASQTNTGNNPIPPPPMFSTQTRESNVDKTVLPPSVARRIGSNQPVIKSQAIESINTDNIFVPTFDPTTVPTQVVSFSDIHSQSTFGGQSFPTSQAKEDVPISKPPHLSNVPPQTQFIPQPPPGFATQPLAPPTSVIAPSSKIAPPPSNMLAKNISAPPMLPPTLISNAPKMFEPSTATVDDKSSNLIGSVSPSSSIFSPASQVTGETVLPQAQTQLSGVGSIPNAGYFSPPSILNAAPMPLLPAPNQPVVSEPPKPLIEPPKATGAINFRMNKKRPQYYSGPIEGVGSISNSIKPVIQPVESGTFQGALFTPEHQQTEQHAPSSVPFDLSKQAENVPMIPQFNVATNTKQSTVFDISQSAPVYTHFDITNPVPDANQYNTAFDLSRPTRETFEQEEPKESIGFGIIGSLKSKLSSIDINKIQHSVTTFFDPAYNNTAKVEDTAQENVPYANVPYQTQTAETNLEIFVPNVQQNNQGYNYQQQVYLNNEYYKYPNFQNQGQPAAGHCSNENNYPSHYPQNYQSPQGYHDVSSKTPMFQQPPSNVLPQEVVNEKPLNAPPKFEDNISEPVINKITEIQSKCIGNVAQFESKVTSVDPGISLIDEESAKSFFEIETSNMPAEIQQAHMPVTAPVQDHSLVSDAFEKIQDKTDEIMHDPISMFDPLTVKLFGKMNVKDDNNVKPANVFASKVFDDKNKPNIPQRSGQNVDLFASVPPHNDKTEDVIPKVFSSLPIDNKSEILKSYDEAKTHNVYASTMFDSKEAIIPKDSLLESLTKVDVPILGVSSVPLFGLVDKTKEIIHGNSDLMTNLDRNSSISFFDHPLKSEEIASKHADTLNRNTSFSFFENLGTPEQKEKRYDQVQNLDATTREKSAIFFENVEPNIQNTKSEIENQTLVLDKEDQSKNIAKEHGAETVDDACESELSICETCREVNMPEDKEDDQDVTTHLIENLTSRIQLSNPVEAPLPESALRETNNPDQAKLDAGQFDEISHITEETIETIQVQSATDLLEGVDEMKSMNYGWAESALKEDYNFNIDPNSIGFYGSNSLFFDKVPTSTEQMKHHEDMLTRQMSAPSAPPAEDDEDTKSDEGGVLDVHSIEQDANKDFPVFEEFVIEPSDADDDYKEKDSELDSFTNRVEKYKNMDPTEPEPPQGLFFDIPPAPISMVSYFDTGNYAVESHYRNTRPTAQTISIPPGFEEEYKKRLALAKEREDKFRNDTTSIPDTSTQTKTTTVASYTPTRDPPSYSNSPAIGVGFNVEANIASLVDEQSEQDPETPSSPKPFPSSDNIADPLKEILPKSSNFYGNAAVAPDEKQQSKLFKFTPAFNAKHVEQPETQEFSTVFATKSAEKHDLTAPPTAFNLKPAEQVPKLPEFSSAFGPKPFDNQELDLTVSSPFMTSNPTDLHVLKVQDFAETFSLKPVENQGPNLPLLSAAFTANPAEQVSNFPPFATSFNLKPVDKEPQLPESSAFIPKTQENLESIKPVSSTSTNLGVEVSKLPKPESASTSKPDIKSETKLPDPINFFTDTAPENPPETFNRLASYFNSPPKTDHAKSFFELSQSQNHYRHASVTEKNKITDLMCDLTSPQNIIVPKEQKIRHVNYFTIEYDAALPDFNKGDNSKDKLEYDDDRIDMNSLVINCRYCTKIFDTNFKVRTAVNDTTEAGTSTKMEPHKEAVKGSVTVNFDGLTIQEESNEGVAGITESRPATEYTPVKHHWFYRVDVEDKSIWRGFSVVDSRALESAYLSSDLNDETVVATDGGRYDVNIIERLRIPVYWSDKPTNVRRCSWFYKGTTDARYVPYTEPVAEKLEEEYRHGMTTGEWHRRLVIPNGEVVVMHGPSVMVHFLHSDAFSTPPQSSSRPRVVRRGHDESEIEDTEPSSIDHLLLLCHGVGSACDMRFRSVEEVVEDFRATSLQLIQSHYRNSYDQGVVSRVEVLPISWHATLHSGETGVDRRLSQITLDSIPRLRSFTNDTVLDVLFYTSPVFCQTIIDTVCKELNRIYELFVKRNPSFKGGVSLGGHSLGSVILYDLLCHQADLETDKSKVHANKNYVQGPAGTGQPCVRYPKLTFAPAALYALGSPIAIFECIRGVESLGASFSLPTCKNFFNIFHPYDPIAYRIEPLIDSRLRDLKPFLIPHHKGRKRMHLELKDTMARVGADLKQKLLESLKSTWNKWKTPPPTDGQLEKVVEEEMEKEQLCESTKEELVREIELSTPDILGRLNNGRRVDYVLQEAPLEMINEYLFAMSSHVGYWESEDTMLLMLREIYSALGVQPDSTVPQQNMTVQRTRTAKQDESVIINASEFPSTSHGAV